MYAPLIIDFESTVKCLSGDDAGKTYATVKWGFTYRYDAMPEGRGPDIQ
jgi:hypothetical protein